MSDDDGCGRGRARREIGSKHGWFLRVKAIATDAGVTVGVSLNSRKQMLDNLGRTSLVGSSETTSL